MIGHRVYLPNFDLIYHPTNNMPNDIDNVAERTDHEIEKMIVEILKTVLEILKKKQSEAEQIPKTEQAPNDRLLLEELRLEYDREISNRKAVENKASSMITVSGAIIAILFGFTAFFFNTAKYNIGNYPYLLASQLSLILGSVVLITVAILFSSLALRLGRNMAIVSQVDRFIRQDRKVSMAEINQDRIQPPPIIVGQYIQSYVGTIRTNIEFLDKKAKLIGIAQICFIIGISLIGATLALSYLRL